MQRVYVAFGLDPEGFWQITPRELVVRLEGARRRLLSEQDGRAWLAWHVAALSRQSKLPDLASLLQDHSKKPPQTLQEQEIGLDQLFLAWGGDPAQLADVRKLREET